MQNPKSKAVVLTDEEWNLVLEALGRFPLYPAPEVEAVHEKIKAVLSSQIYEPS